MLCEEFLKISFYFMSEWKLTQTFKAVCFVLISDFALVDLNWCYKPSQMILFLHKLPNKLLVRSLMIVPPSKAEEILSFGCWHPHK